MKDNNSNSANKRKEIREEKNLNKSVYPSGEDIYVKSIEEKEINPEDVSKKKEANGNYKTGKWNEKDFKDDKSGKDLDVPGSELDDEQENTGNEDEENNYYSLGGDDHNHLDEDRGD